MFSTSSMLLATTQLERLGVLTTTALTSSRLRTSCLSLVQLASACTSPPRLLLCPSRCPTTPLLLLNWNREPTRNLNSHGPGGSSGLGVVSGHLPSAWPGTLVCLWVRMHWGSS